MTSSSAGSPFTTSSVTGYNDFQDYFNQDETFMASFKDGSDHYMVAVCSLDGSNRVVVDEIVMSSAGARDLSEPTFSGTVDIVIGSNAHNTYQRRLRNCQSDDTTQHAHRHINDFIFSFAQNSSFTNDQLWISPFGVSVTGWYYGFYVYENSCTAADYRLCLYDTNENCNPDKILARSPVVTHNGTGTEVEIDFDTTLTITAITIGTPGEVTYTGTDPSNGDRIYITGANNVTNVNETSFLVSNVNTTANTFDLQDLEGTNYGTTGTAATTGTVHFPIYLGAGDGYMTGFVGDTNALNFNSPVVGDEWCKPSSLGPKTSYFPCMAVYKSFTYAALPETPDMSTGSWTDESNKMIGSGLLMVEG